MATNIFGSPGGTANILLARMNAGMGAIGFNAGNVTVIFEVNGAAGTVRSWKPGRTINPITTITAGRGYYIIALTDMDLEDYFYPPLTGLPVDEEFDNDEFD